VGLSVEFKNWNGAGSIPFPVLPGVIPPGEEQRDPLPLPRRRDDAGGEQSRPFLGARRGFLLLRARRARPRQRQDLHAGVIVIKDFALRGLLFDEQRNRYTFEQLIRDGEAFGGIDFIDISG
jgi:hypothetical protein